MRAFGPRDDMLSKLAGPKVSSLPADDMARNVAAAPAAVVLSPAVQPFVAPAAPQAAAPGARGIGAPVPIGLRFVENAGQWDGEAASW